MNPFCISVLTILNAQLGLPNKDDLEESNEKLNKNKHQFLLDAIICAKKYSATEIKKDWHMIHMALIHKKMLSDLLFNLLNNSNENKQDFSDSFK